MSRENRQNIQLCVYALLGVVLAVSLVIAPKTAHAIKVRELSEQTVRDFIEATSQITSGQDFSKSQKEIQDFLKRHLHDDSRFSSMIIYDIPGQDPQMSSMALGKNDFMEQVSTGVQKLENYHTETEVVSIKISKDKQKATVETIGTESGTMNIPDADGNMNQVPVHGQSNCHQIVTINEKYVVQLYNANCETHITFESLETSEN